MFFIPNYYLESLMEEDLPMFDMTVDAMNIEHKAGLIECYPKKACVLAGLEEAERIFTMAGAKAETFIPSGYKAPAETLCLRVTGSAGQLHGVYKLAQNIMEYSSGIASRCFNLLEKAREKQPNIQLAVTRKHFPGAKRLALKAALAGGAQVHRFGLSDSILVFDQHRVFTEGLKGFLSMVEKMAFRCPEKKLAAEANSQDEALEFAKAGIHIVQCEHFSPAILEKTVRDLHDINPNILIAAAGGINADNTADYASTGVDILVTSWIYFGKPEDIKMKFSAI